ncbi:hypothetical protein TSOC_008647 [Tetrabaena socialis]|uniref:Uncharacterized protein n=1 Tax=Tetrabaena socialis TaxID=47790 RepID=A0A2J7ZXX2_9CHLO|nr:hypothetical protein TSOC_008647 [Tetrabaena socialis]|eukprot:PNH05120.1 hypothetical protein TSOC_008647 [Tetrabaena socialis]
MAPLQDAEAGSNDQYPRTSPVTTAAVSAAGVDATSPMMGHESIDVPRLYRRLDAYAAAYGIPESAARQMQELLHSPLAMRLVSMPQARLYDILVTDAYKPRMHVMYDRFMTGVRADFALVPRRLPSPAADPATLPTRRPELWAAFESAAVALQGLVPYGPCEVEALRTQFGLEMPRSLLERAHREGVAPVSWQPVGQPQQHAASQGAAASRSDGGGCVAVASGALVSASLVETSLMQRFQQLAVAAQVAELREAFEVAAPPSPASPAPPGPLPLDRTERLASSLARLALTVEAINALRHGCKVALFAGRRSSDLLYLLLQNLYGASQLHGYGGTSSLFVAAVVGREWGGMGLPERERWGGAGRLVGTHAHEQTSAVQQLLSAYDVEAGRRCGLPHPVAVTPLLAHLLFLAANGGGGPGGAGATALPDTFTTPAFLAVARAAAVPRAFRADVEGATGWAVPEHARVFDLFRMWRLDSGPYEPLAELIVAAWEERCAELRAEGRPELPRPQLMHSNLDSVDHIARMCRLDARIRPTVLAFGTLADGFLPFLRPEQRGEAGRPLEPQGAGPPPPPAPLLHGAGPSPAPGPAGPQQHAGADDARPTLGLASVVMKLVQARAPRPLPPLAAGGPPPPPPPACAIKLGDGNSGKAQTDPRLEPGAAAEVLAEAVAMARGSAVAAALDAVAISAVLAEAYEAVTRRGVLMAETDLPIRSAGQCG